MTSSIRWSLQRTVAPTTVVTTQELKAHFRETLVDGSNDNTIAGYGAAAEDAIEKELARAMLQQTWVLKLSCFPGCEIRLPRPPTSSVSSITYLDTSGALLTLDPSQYTLDSATEPARILKPYGVTWPPTRAIDNAVAITYVTGHATAGAVPAGIKVLVKQLAVDLYNTRESNLDVSSWIENPTHARIAALYRVPTEFTYR